MITYEWQFYNCKVIQHENGLDNIIKSVDWRLMAIDGVYCVSIEGTTEFANPSPQFVEFTDVTKDMMTNWVVAGISADNMAKIEQSLAEQLKELKKPVLVQMQLPFQ
jgi:hypothetical protein